MSTETRMQLDPFDRFRSELENAKWNREFLADYVGELSRQKHEDDIFQRMAFHLPDSGEDSASSKPTSSLSDLYEAMSAEQKAALRRLWHEKIRREAYQHDDLRTRLSWRFLV